VIDEVITEVVGISEDETDNDTLPEDTGDPQVLRSVMFWVVLPLT